MNTSGTAHSRVSRATIENVLLFLFCACLYCFKLDSVPPNLEQFEVWVNNYLPTLSKPWEQMYRDFAQVGHNDSNCSVNAPIWLLLVKGSLSVFGTSPLGYRLPCALLTACAPVFMAEFVRRYFVRSLGLPVGLLLATQQHVMWFGRTGGYIGPTLALFTLCLLLAGMISFENKRRPWIWLTLCVIALPYFYSTIRYYFAIPLAMLTYRFLASRNFRRHQLAPLLASVICIAVSLIPLTEQGIKSAIFFFISGRGEQLLVTERTINEGFEAESLPAQYRLSGMLRENIPQRLADLEGLYTRGNRFFHPRHQFLHTESIWLPLKPWLLGCLALGALYSLLRSLRLKRFIIPLCWSIWAWIPLLFTTGVSPNRLFLGVPADVFFVVLGVYAPLELAKRFLPTPIVKTLAVIAWMGLGFACYYSASSYFVDYQLAPQI